MKSRAKRFLIISFTIITVLCIGIFFFQIAFLEKKSAQTINDVGTIYMGGMNEQISGHFKTNLELCWTRVNSVLRAVEPESCEYGPEMFRRLEEAGRSNGFEYLMLYTRDGEIEMIYGESVEAFYDGETFTETLNADRRNATLAVTESGKKIALVGISTVYPMEEGKICTAIIAGIPVETLQKELELGCDSSFVETSIVRKDGTFVIASDKGDYSTYMDKLSDVLSGDDKVDERQYIKQLKSAIATGQMCSMVFYAGKKRMQLYSTPLPDSEWCLVTAMSYGTLDKAVKQLDKERMYAVLICYGIIVTIFLIVFIIYYRMINQKMLQLEEARAQAEHASRAKSEFLSNMSHDIRTPMNAIMGMTSIAMLNPDNKKQVENCLKKIALSGNHLLGLINNVLDMSRIESGRLSLNMESISLKEVVDSIVNTIQPQMREKEQIFDIYLRNVETERIRSDSVRLHQVLLNLLSNAMKFTPERGRIAFTMEEESSPKGEAFVRIHLRVKDNGIGMSEEFRKRIFESFMREDSLRVHKTEGAGLGMTITQYIVETMGGTIGVESQPGKGTEFHVILDAERTNEPEQNMELPDWKLLVVDTNEDIGKNTVSYLEAMGTSAGWCRSGREAVELVRQQHEKGEDYQMVLVDGELSGWDDEVSETDDKMSGMHEEIAERNGIETARTIRMLTGNEVPVLLMAAYDWSCVEEEAREAGITGFLSKPLFKSTLFEGLKGYGEGMVPARKQPVKQKSLSQGGRILVAEDNEINWEIVNTLLQEMGLVLERAEDGQVCVDKFYAAPEGYYRMILMDIRMPVLTGYEAAKRIRDSQRVDSDIPIIAMTADAFTEDIEKCRQYKMNGHIAKPVDMNKLLELLEKYLGKN